MNAQSKELIDEAGIIFSDLVSDKTENWREGQRGIYKKMQRELNYSLSKCNIAQSILLLSEADKYFFDVMFTLGKEVVLPDKRHIDHATKLATAIEIEARSCLCK